MRREVLALLSNAKVTYIEFQDDLWVTFDPWLSYSEVAFGLSFSQSDSWNFSSFNYNKLENMKTLHIPLFGFFLQNNIYNISQNILQ